MRYLLLALALAPAALPAENYRLVKALIVDGQNNHKWMETTPALMKILQDSHYFVAFVATTPPKGEDWSAFDPKFSDYDVVISNYNGELWPEKNLKALADYVRKGGGFVAYHAADNAFPESSEYNEMIGVGGWGNRNEKSGPYLRLRDGAFAPDASTPGRGGSHGRQHEFKVTIRDRKHPITKGLPLTWMHAKDELYDRLRGPARNVHVLASAFSDAAAKGSGEEEPMLMTIDYGEGRVFHTTLGDNTNAMKCVGFITTFLRGAEWAATGKVTQKIPKDFPRDAVSIRE